MSLIMTYFSLNCNCSCYTLNILSDTAEKPFTWVGTIQMSVFDICLAILVCFLLAKVVILFGPTTYLNRSKSSIERAHLRQLLPKKWVPTWLPLYVVIPDGASLSQAKRESTLVVFLPPWWQMTLAITQHATTSLLSRRHTAVNGSTEQKSKATSPEAASFYSLCLIFFVRSRNNLRFDLLEGFEGYGYYDEQTSAAER